MGNNPSFGQRKAAKAFKGLGFLVVKDRGKGSHYLIVHETANFPLPKDKHDGYPKGFCKGIENYLNRCGFTYDDFLLKI